MNTAFAETQKFDFGPCAISLPRALAIARAVTAVPHDQHRIMTDLVELPHDIGARGLLLQALLAAVARVEGADEVRHLRREAGFDEDLLPFRVYSLSAFYPVYYLAARRAYPHLELRGALRAAAGLLVPVLSAGPAGGSWRRSPDPGRVLPALAERLQEAMPGTRHDVTPAGENTVEWACRVEPVSFYRESLLGLIDGLFPGRLRLAKAREIRLGTEALHIFTVSW